MLPKFDVAKLFAGKPVPTIVDANPKDKIKTQNTKKSAASDSTPAKATTGQRARRVAVALVLKVLIPVLTLSLIVVTTWTHDPEQEDCQEDRPVNCSWYCPGPPRPCWRNQGLYLIPFLGIYLGWAHIFFTLYMAFIILYDTKPGPEDL